MKNNITSIGIDAFNTCSNLINIQLPDTIQDIGTNAFINCSKINIDIPKDIISLSASAFKGCTNIDHVTINGIDGVTICDSAFQNCTNISSVDLGKNVLSVGNNVFTGCTKIKTATLPQSILKNSLTSTYGFQGSKTSLLSVYIHNDVSSIPTKAFEGCNSLSSVSFGGNNIQ